MSCPDFYSAVQNDDKIVLAWLCKKKKEDIDEKDVCGRTPLWVASYNNNTDIVNLLISSGADINGADNYGITPLHNASRYGNTNIMALLISSEADINQAADNGDTPLIIAALYNRMPIVRLLVESGADITIRGDENKTAYETAYEERNTEIADFLKNHWNHLNTRVKQEIDAGIGDGIPPFPLKKIIKNYAVEEVPNPGETDKKETDKKET